MLEFYRRAADRLSGKMLLAHLDLHTNMDLLAALRGPERLCLDLLDQPEVIDAPWYRPAPCSAGLERVAAAGRMEESGYSNGGFAATAPRCCNAISSA